MRRKAAWPRVARARSGKDELRRRARHAQAMKLRRAIRGGVLVRGHRHLCAGARRRQAAVPRAQLQRRPRAVHRHRVEPSTRRALAHDLLRPTTLFRLGHPHRRRERSALQSDVVSQRLGLAARQCADRGWACALRLARRRCDRVFGALFDAASYMDLRRLPELFCGFPRAAAAARRSTRSPARRRPGPPARRSCCCKPRSGSSSIRTATRSCCARRSFRRFSTKSPCAICSLAGRASISRCGATAPTCRCRSCAMTGTSAVAVVYS